MNRGAVGALASVVLFLLVPVAASAQPDNPTCGQDVCAAGGDDGTVVVTGSDVDCGLYPEHSSCSAPDDSTGSTDGANRPRSGVDCVLYAEHPSCRPPCVLDVVTGGWANEPCIDPGLPAPCDAVPGADGADVTVPCGAAPAVPPVIQPPGLDEAAERALAQVVWPTIDPAPTYSGGLDRYAAGYQYSLHVGGYEGWEPLTASVTITQIVIQAGVTYSQDFSASVIATPREVLWDLGEINDDGNDRPPSRHSPPTELVCDGPGVAGYFGDGSFQDWQTYDSYGGNGVCEYVFWGITPEMGALAQFGAEVVWDVELLTDWDGVTTNVGEHRELFTSGGHEVDVFWAVTLLTEAEDGGY